MSSILVTGSEGYIGSFLARHLMSRSHVVSRCMKHVPYQTPSFYPPTVIHLAAHSSVSACANDPEGAVRNNLLDLIKFAMLLPPETRLFFASTGAIHDQAEKVTLYDATKRGAEAVLPTIHPNTCIMRFGTVCGVSPFMRSDTLLNAMTQDAVRKGVVQVRNRLCNRPVLFIQDLADHGTSLVEGAGMPEIVEMAKKNRTIHQWGEQVASLSGAELIEQPGNGTYDFRMPTMGDTDERAVIQDLLDHWKRQEATRGGI